MTAVHLAGDPAGMWSKVRICSRKLATAPASVVVVILRVYQRVVSPLYGPTCRFYPSCSQYALRAIQLHGVVRGGFLAGWRLVRCNPWNGGGVDDVPPGKTPTHLGHD